MVALGTRFAGRLRLESSPLSQPQPPLAGAGRRPARQIAPPTPGALPGDQNADRTGSQAPMIVEQIRAQPGDAVTVAGTNQARSGVCPRTYLKLRVVASRAERGVILEHPRQQDVVPAAHQLDG